MNRRKIRNALALVVAAAAASLEAPRLAHDSLGAATAELANAPAAISQAVARVASNVTESHLGFDTNIYPGDEAMNAWKRFGEYEWVGYYLPAPCHKDDSWSGKRAHLTANGWGLAVIYVGQQTWGKKLPARPAHHAAKSSKSSKKSKHARGSHGTRTMTRESPAPVATTGADCSAAHVNAAQGERDAHDAIAKTEHEGFPQGTVVFLDVEHMDAIPDAMRDYYRAWTRTVLADGRYRPGIYAHTHNASTIYDDVSDVFDQMGAAGDPSFWVAGSRGFSPDRLPTDVGHDFANVWQGLLDVVRTHNGVKLPIDISVASAASPSAAVQ